MDLGSVEQDGKEKVSVTVVDDRGKPLQEAQVQVFPNESIEIVDAGETDQRGYFETFLDPNQAWDIWVYKPGFNQSQGKVFHFGTATS